MRFHLLSFFIGTAGIGLVLAMSPAHAQVQSEGKPQMQNAKQSKAGTKSKAAASKQPGTSSHGIAIGDMDRRAIPGDNFYQYANGAWIRRAVIPADRASVGVFTRLLDRTNKRTAALIQDVAKSKPPANSDRARIANLYQSYMDVKAIEARGLKPLEPKLKETAAIRDKKQLAYALGKTLRADVDPLNNTNFHTANLFGIWIAPGFHESGKYIPYLLEGGLILPNRAYYVDDSAQMQKIREAYRKYATAMFRLAGFAEPEQRAASVLALETAIAKTHNTLTEDQDVQKADNLWKRSDFAHKAPGLDWHEYFRGAGLEAPAQFDVWQPKGIAGESALVASQPLETWKDWLALHWVEEYAGVLPKSFDDQNFNLFGKTLSGVTKQRPRWQRGVAFVNAHLGDAVGKIYAEKYFSPTDKAKVEEMVKNLVDAYRTRLQAVSWMDAKTKAQAEAKLGALYVGVGYPDNWKSYSGYTVKSDDLFGNLWRGRLFHYHRQIARLGKPVDRKEWSMEPQTVNAVNLPLQVALNFPAAILQPPFFDPKAPAAVNYGAIGAIIGHEISHTFDTEGSLFDAQGRLRNWWTSADLAHFEAAAAKLAKQYSAYKPFPDLHVNGEQTIAENIADLAGLAAAFDAYHASLREKKTGQKVPVQDGFSGDQQFFIAYAQSWASKTRPAALRRQVMTDPHAPAQYRTDTVRNLDAWYKSFDVKAGQKLYLAPAKRVTIW
jgi:endothelin-converting enzyme/putative endopeptidase